MVMIIVVVVVIIVDDNQTQNTTWLVFSVSAKVCSAVCRVRKSPFSIEKAKVETGKVSEKFELKTNSASDEMTEITSDRCRIDSSLYLFFSFCMLMILRLLYAVCTWWVCTRHWAPMWLIIYCIIFNSDLIAAWSVMLMTLWHAFACSLRWFFDIQRGTRAPNEIFHNKFPLSLARAVSTRSGSRPSWNSTEWKFQLKQTSQWVRKCEKNALKYFNRLVLTWLGDDFIMLSSILSAIFRGGATTLCCAKVADLVDFHSGQRGNLRFIWCGHMVDLTWSFVVNTLLSYPATSCRQHATVVTGEFFILISLQRARCSHLSLAHTTHADGTAIIAKCFYGFSRESFMLANIYRARW